jgi:hypothetical protein
MPVPTKQQPLVLSADELGAHQKAFDPARFYTRAVALAKRIPNVREVRLVRIDVKNLGDQDVADLTRGVTVEYRFMVDPPPDEGCEATVMFTADRITVYAEKGSCTLHPYVPPTCSFAEIMSRLRRDAHAKIEHVTYSGTWSANGRVDVIGCK